ncbi:hypothetical protein [Plasmodium yoelii yoelii]|uniref:Uncharacterized protein n=1 Tax=Plasmodium yoelii yoelii TaxID=73239 RepID=Q7R746_PLAYO|nr:hypothetical protein [Plasmodium yoelii yoelii]
MTSAGRASRRVRRWRCRVFFQPGAWAPDARGARGQCPYHGAAGRAQHGRGGKPLPASSLLLFRFVRSGLRSGRGTGFEVGDRGRLVRALSQGGGLLPGSGACARRATVERLGSGGSRSCADRGARPLGGRRPGRKAVTRRKREEEIFF